MKARQICILIAAAAAASFAYAGAKKVWDGRYAPSTIHYDAIGPDLKEACGSTLGMRQRQRGDVDCSYDKEQRGSPYTCHFGIDLRKGKSIAGSTC